MTDLESFFRNDAWILSIFILGWLGWRLRPVLISKTRGNIIAMTGGLLAGLLGGLAGTTILIWLTSYDSRGIDWYNETNSAQRSLTFIAISYLVALAFGAVAAFLMRRYKAASIVVYSSLFPGTVIIFGPWALGVLMPIWLLFGLKKTFKNKGNESEPNLPEIGLGLAAGLLGSLFWALVLFVTNSFDQSFRDFFFASPRGLAFVLPVYFFSLIFALASMRLLQARQSKTVIYSSLAVSTIFIFLPVWHMWLRSLM